MHTLKYKVGDLVKIVADKIDHDIPIGTICTVEITVPEERLPGGANSWQEYYVTSKKGSGWVVETDLEIS